MGLFVWPETAAQRSGCAWNESRDNKFSPPFGLEPAHMGSRVSRLRFF